MNQENQKCSSETGCGCKCACHKMSGIFVFLAGLFYLLGVLGTIDSRTSSIVVASMIMAYGLKNSFGKGRCKCCSKS